MSMRFGQRVGDWDLVEPHPSVGVVFDVKRFEKPSSGGCARGWLTAGWDHFPFGDFSLDVGLGVQRIEIDAKAAAAGEAGIEKHLAAEPSEAYRLGVRLRIREKCGDFGVRVGLVARNEDGSELEKFSESCVEISAESIELWVEAVVPSGTALISPEIKVQTSAPGEAGSAEIYSTRLERLS